MQALLLSHHVLLITIQAETLTLLAPFGLASFLTTSYTAGNVNTYGLLLKNTYINRARTCWPKIPLFLVPRTLSFWSYVGSHQQSWRQNYSHGPFSSLWSVLCCTVLRALLFQNAVMRPILWAYPPNYSDKQRWHAYLYHDTTLKAQGEI